MSTSTAEPSSRSLAIWIGLLSAAALGAVSYPLWLGDVYSVHDAWDFYLPMRAFYARSIQQGDWPLWCPDVFAGYYLHGAGQAGMCHPAHYVMYRFLPLTLAYDFEILFAYPAMFGGMYLFLRRWSLRRDCSLFGAMLFAFSTFNLMRLVHPNALSIIAHYPWVLYCMDIVARSTDRRRAVAGAIGLALLNGSELLLGYPQYFWFSAVIMALYGVFLLLTRSLSVPRIAMLAVAVGLGVGLGAVQLLPTIDSLALSVRRLSPDWQDEEAALAGSITPRYMLQAVSPYSLNVSHKQRIYFGAVPLLLVVWAAVRLRHLAAARSLVAAGLVAVVLMLWLTLGEHGYLYRLQVYLPGVGSFRYPSRYVHLLCLATSICGALRWPISCRSAPGATSRGAGRRWR